VGVSGGGNQLGRLLFEPNALLRDQSGYGRAGTYDVGQWQEISLSNPFVAAGLDFILGPVADARVDVSPAPPGSGVDEATAKAHADFVRWAVTEQFKLSTHIESAARGFLLSGFALFEPVYRQALRISSPGQAVADDEAQTKGAAPMTRGLVWVPASLGQRLPNSLDINAWQEDEEGRLTGVVQSGLRGMGGHWVRPTLDASKVLLYSWKREGNNWAGQSQFRAVWYIAGRIMPLLLKLAGVTVQREGAGLPQVTREDAQAPDITPEQRSELMDFMANSSFHEASGIIMPPGWKTEWTYSPGADKTFIIDIWKALGLVVLQQIGAQQLTLGTDSTGSRSVGEVHDARAMAFVRKVLRFLESVLNGDSRESHTGFVRHIVDFNFGPQAAYPRLKLTPQRPEMSPTELATAVNQAKAGGLFTPTAGDENTFRERAGFAPLTEEERDAAKQKAASLAPQIQPGFDRPRMEGADEEEVPKGRQLQASAQRGGWAPWRPLRASEARVSFAKLDAYLTAQREVFERRVRPVVVSMLARAGNDVATAMEDGKVRPEEIASIEFDTAALARAVRAYCAEVRKAGGESAALELSKPLRAASEEEQDERDDELARQAKDDADELEEAEANRLVRRIVGRTKGELEREAVDALRTGETAMDVLDRAVRRQVESGAFRADAGYVTTKLFSGGRDEVARAMGGVASVEYSSLLDSSTCGPCRDADGSTAAFGSPEHDAMVPPNRDCAGGDNCRCLLVFIPGDDGGDE